MSENIIPDQTPPMEERLILKEQDDDLQAEGGNEELVQNELTLNQDVAQHKWRYFIALFLVGIFNNNGYVLVQAGSNSLASAFQE